MRVSFPTIIPSLALALGLVPLLGCNTAQQATGKYAVIDGTNTDVPAIKMGDQQTINRILNEAKTNSKIIDILTELCETHGSRLTGSTACENANNWAMAKFDSWGLSDARLMEWGTLDARFDRLDSVGEAVKETRDHDDDKNDKDDQNQDDQPKWESIRPFEFTTLSWTRGTDGPSVGQAVKMPESLDDFESNADSYAGAWVLLPATYSSRRGGRGVGFSMRERNDLRDEIRTGQYDPFAEPEAETWAGTVTIDDEEFDLIFLPDRDDTGDIIGGTMSVPGIHEGPVSDVFHNKDILSFVWENPQEQSTLQLTIDGESMTGIASDQHAVRLDQTVGPDKHSPTRPGDQILQRVLEAGPAGFISTSTDERVWTTRPNGWRDTDPAALPADIEVLVRRSDYDFLNSRIADGEPTHIRFDLPHIIEAGPIPVYNTIAEIPGSKYPDEVIIVSAHLDSWDGPMSLGTTDNGTGSSVVLEAARLLSVAGAKPDRTIRFILWTGEEQGLLGSAAYVQSLSEEERSKISAVFVDDGGTNYEGGIPAADAMVDYLAAATAAVNGQFFSETDGKWLDVNVRPTGEKIKTHGGSDHASFNKVGVPGFFWDEVGRANYRFGWHTQNDRLDLAIPEYLQQSSACMAITAYNLACAPDLLPRKPDQPSEPIVAGTLDAPNAAPANAN